MASFFFKRFDTTESKERKQRLIWLFKRKECPVEDHYKPAQMHYKNLPIVEHRFSFLNLVHAELLLMLRGNSYLWLILTLGMFITSIFTPMEFSYKVALPLLWFLQILILSKLGSREVTHRCNEYIFSSAFPLRRQLPATLSASVLILLTLAIPLLLKVLFTGDLYGVYAIIGGAVFIPSFAITSGILTGGSKFFEVIFTIIVYGILDGIPYIDFTGAIPGSRELGVANYLLTITALLLILAFLGRKRQITHA